MRYNSAEFERDIPRPLSNFAETVGATAAYRVTPIARQLRGAFEFGAFRQPDYSPLQDMEGYEQYASHLARATSAEHMAYLKQTINMTQENRQVLHDATLGNQLAAGLFDPINLVALPIGGPTASIGRAALRAGVSVGAVETAYELGIMQPFDPVQTATESALNIVTSTLFGAAFGGALTIPRARAAQVHQRTTEQIKEQMTIASRLENLSGLTREDITSAGPRESRPFNNMDDNALSARVQELESEAQLLEARARNQVNNAGMRERADELYSEAQFLRNEIGLRQLEADNVDFADPYRILPTRFTESIFYQAISTPLKRALQSNFPSSVKQKFVQSFNDSGMALLLNSIGLREGPSVYQLSAVSNGRWVAAHDKIAKLWAEDINSNLTTRLDINITNLSKKATRSEDTFENWMTRVNEKRIKKDQNLSDAEAKAIAIIDEYFKDAELRLEEVGLLGTRKGVQKKIENLEAEIAALNTRLARVTNTKRGQLQRRMIEDRRERLESFLARERQVLNNFEDFSATNRDEDVFMPRFWDIAAIRRNRAIFEKVLADWYTQNPRVWMMDKKGRWVQKDLDTAPAKVKERVDQTIARILNEEDPTNVDKIGFGYGRSKHFRHRQIDIPNSLVTDFIITNPLSVMKTYAARIEPRYEYAKLFSKDVDGVLLDMELDMIQAGASTKDIDAMRRDYLHMYDRVAGAILRNPDAINQKAAFVLREAASMNYMGSAGFAAFPDFGRIVMEYDMNNVIRGIQTLLDKEQVKLSANEVRLAGEAIDILKGTAHLRLTEDFGNSVDTNHVWSQARNAFYILNGLSPITGIAKQLAGIVDMHTIIDYSIKLRDGKLDDQARTWLARYNIDEGIARRITEQPFEKTKNGLYLANTEKWTDPDLVAQIANDRLSYTPPKNRFAEMSDSDLTAHFAQEFEGVQIFTDKKIVGDYFAKLKREGWPDLLGFMTDLRDIPDGGFSVHLDRDAITARFNRIKNDPRSAKEIIDDARARFERGDITEDLYHHIKNETEALESNLIQDINDYFEFILSHELHHSRVNRRVDESIASWENRIDEEALAYMRNQREAGRALALEKEIELVAREQQELVDTFRSSLNSGVLNTIMSGTPADKPIITDGVVYIPINIARKFGMKEDSKFRGFARIENGLLGLPFQFYSYTLANVNKTMGAMATGQVKNRALGIATMMGLAYMSLKIRTPDYVWAEMTPQDKFARSFDMSGVAALYSDLFYRSMHTSLALGGPNITAGLLSPKFPQQESVMDAITGFAGAGPSWAYDNAVGIYDFAMGDYGGGAKTVIRNLPFARLWFWKDEMNQITHAMAN